MRPSFQALPVPTPDPLFAIGTEAKLAGPNIINGTLGVFMDEDGKPLLFPSSRKAIQDISEKLESFDYSYPLLTGLSDYRTVVTNLILPDAKKPIASMASTGGTGALAINLRLMKMLLKEEKPTIILPVPAWGNHPPVCKGAGFQIVDAPYLIDGRASIEGIIDAMKKTKGPFGILLQVGCHNPTGLDLTMTDWKNLIAALQHHDCIALLDFAYQGFIGEPEEDAAPIKLFVDSGILTLATWSASKNHSIYGLRTGIACAFVENDDEKKVTEGHYSSITRTLHSASATFGQSIIARVQMHYKEEWLSDLRAARETLKTKRAALLKGLPDSFTPCLQGNGMFAMMPLTSEQLLTLKNKHRVFLVPDGRINIAGIPHKKIRELCEKVVRVI